MTIPCALSQSPLAAHHSAASAGARLVGGLGCETARLNSASVMADYSSTADRLNMALLGIIQKHPIARHQRVPVLAPRRRNDAIGRIARRLPGKEGRGYQQIGRYVGQADV